MLFSYPAILRQMDLFQMKNASCIVNILDIYTKLIPLYSPSPPQSSEPNSISLALLLTELAYLAMIFIFQVPHTADSRYHLKNK